MKSCSAASGDLFLVGQECGAEFVRPNSVAPLKVAFRIRDLRDTDDTKTSDSNIYLIQVAQSDLAFRCYWYIIRSNKIIVITASIVITIKFCSWSRNRVTRKMDLRAVKTHASIPTAWELRSTQCNIFSYQI